jgi:hypothetical protein
LEDAKGLMKRMKQKAAGVRMGGRSWRQQQKLEAFCDLSAIASKSKVRRKEGLDALRVKIGEA